MDNQESLLVRCKQLSVNIAEYFDGMKYLGDVDSAEQVTPAFLNRLAVTMVMDELAEIGIVSNFEIEDFILDVKNFEALFAMRERFDRINLYEFLKALTEEQLSLFHNLLDETAEDGDLLLELSHLLCEFAPLDLSYKLIQECSTQWTSVFKFRDHLNALRRKLENVDTTKAVVNDSNVNEIIAFLNNMKLRETAITKCVDLLLSKYQYLNETVLLTKVAKYDHEKLDPGLLPLFAALKDGEDEPEHVQSHHLEVDHHIEYWENKKKNKQPIHFTIEHGIMIMLSLMLDKLSLQDILTEYKRLSNMVSEDILDRLATITKLEYTSLMGVIYETFQV